MTPLALYIHWPFCLKKCPYCDFNSHVREGIDVAAWQQAYIREISHYAQHLPRRTLGSVFFGGGTPSLMPPTLVEAILNTIAQHWPMAHDVEVTLEANPTSAEAEKFKAFRAAGVNRLSLGIQALDDATLHWLGRTHSAQQARQALTWAAHIFPRYSFDLIYARANHTLSDWQKELQQALGMAGGHMSLYQLTLEPHTAFYARAQGGEILTASDDMAADMYEMTQDMMNAAGMPAYEISNHAAAGHESRHNTAYWQYDDYVGIGPGAHGRFRDEAGTVWATVDEPQPEAWLTKVQASGLGQRSCEVVDDPTQRT
ncbi:MAG: coproporphyrinogen III oxidase, partial [Alphaproteobacteria bacterium]|nr:coproporphyrinogen III oxidase [Alphaproteobacteria bacterium]